MTAYDRLESRELQHADISALDLSGANMRDCDLRGADLRGALFDGAFGGPFDTIATLTAEHDEALEELAWLREDLRDAEGGASPVVTVDASALPPDVVVYLASPYTHADAAIVSERYRVTRAATAALLRAGVHVYSPIVHCHALARAHALPTDAEFWRAYNCAMIRVCTAFAVLTIDGWRESTGVSGETAYATGLGREVTYLEVSQ